MRGVRGNMTTPNTDEKYEYYLNFWGQVQNDKLVEKELGITDSDFWFDSKWEREQVRNTLQAVADKHNVIIAFAEEEGVSSYIRKAPIAKVLLGYKGKHYNIEMDYHPGYPEHTIRFMFEEGNYCCDCNRSIFIQEQCDENFKELDCGDEIELMKLEVEYRWKQ